MLQLVISSFFLIFKLPFFFKTNYHFFISYGSLKFCIGVSKILKNKQTKKHTVFAHSEGCEEAHQKLKAGE